MKVRAKTIPKAIYDMYNLADYEHKGWVYFQIDRGMYGLPQAGRIAYEQLVRFLAPHGYEPVPVTPGLWRHKERDIRFVLIVDDFGIRYTKCKDLDHLIHVLKQHYEMNIDWNGEQYCGLQFSWDYENQIVDILCWVICTCHPQYTPTCSS